MHGISRHKGRRATGGGVRVSDIVDRLRAAGCVFAEDEARLLVAQATSATELAAMVARRVAGLPLEHVLGWAEFCGIRIAVDPGVFVPRHRTELMVAQAADLVRAAAGAVRPTRPVPVVVDLCCGSGAVGTALAMTVTGVELHAADIDPIAVACARRNVEAVGGTVSEGDLFAALPATLRGRVDVLVANTPYVPTAAIRQMPREARLYEARIALDGGADGFDVQRRVAAEASAWLAPGGSLLVEVSEPQGPRAVEVVADHGLTARLVRSDELDATVVIGTAPPTADCGRWATPCLM